jgi:hypothetical protein
MGIDVFLFTIVPVSTGETGLIEIKKNLLHSKPINPSFLSFWVPKTWVRLLNGRCSNSFTLLGRKVDMIFNKWLLKLIQIWLRNIISNINSFWSISLSSFLCCAGLNCCYIKDVTLLLSKIADKSDRLINNSTTNLAESWMHIRTKFDGGKVYNLCNRGSWYNCTKIWSSNSFLSFWVPKTWVRLLNGRCSNSL